MPTSALKVLLFGASGSAGGSVLRACLASPAVDSVRALTRRPLPLAHPQLREVLHQDFADFSGSAAAFQDVDVCLYCLGISATQVSGEAEYRRITFDFALAAAAALRAASPGAAFHFISGQGAALDSRFMWARVKAETERELIARFDAVCWRPAAIDGEPSASSPRIYNLTRPLFRLLSPFRSLYIEGQALGRAMLQGAVEGMHGRIVENREIRDLSDRVGT
jgi:uncharacterized protein YbjT (DUF2867 family)